MQKLTFENIKTKIKKCIFKEIQEFST
jgi:hypothetical protein